MKVMNKYYTAAVESALRLNKITLSKAIEMGISEDAIQKITNDQVNEAYEAAFEANSTYVS